MTLVLIRAHRILVVHIFSRRLLYAPPSLLADLHLILKYVLVGNTYLYCKACLPCMRGADSMFPVLAVTMYTFPLLPLLLTCLGVLRSVLGAAVEGCNVLTLCEMGDRLILEETSKVYKREKEMKKGELIQYTAFMFNSVQRVLLFIIPVGIAFPTCVSLNHCVCHFSPLRSDPPVLLAAGDLLKV